MIQGESLAWGSPDELSDGSPEKFLLGDHVRVGLEVSETSDVWRPVEHVFDGTVVGGPILLESVSPETVINVMPDEPFPVGDMYASTYPIYFPLEPFWVVRDTESDVRPSKLLCRYVVTRIEDAGPDSQADV